MSEGDLRSILGATRALVKEWAEEGLEAWEHVEAAPVAPVTSDSEAAAPAQALDPLPPIVESPDEPAAPIASAGWTERPSLDEVREVLGDCTRCRLHEGRTQIVFGDGDSQADLMFVGEGPGENEDRTGIPFCGRAGELLTSMIEKGLEIPRSTVYICNIVKCRPPKNRNPQADEVAACRSFLDGQIAAVAPKAIVALGKPATSTLLGRDVAITKLRGQWQSYQGIPLMPTFHPAFLLRQYTPENRRLVWSDLKAAHARSIGS